MALILTINGTPGYADAFPIGDLATLSDDNGWSDAVQVSWALSVPPGSSAALATTGWQIAPFDNTFTPDIPGSYRASVTAILSDGSQQQASILLSVDQPWVFEGGNLPAPQETTEGSGWADRANVLLRLAGRTYRGSREVAFLNDTGGPLADGAIVSLTSQRRWPDLTGGTPVGGVQSDYIASATGGLGVDFLAYVVGGGCADGDRGIAVIDGIVQVDPTAWGVTPGTIQTVYYDGPGNPPTASPNAFPLGRAWAAAADADPSGWLYLDTGHLRGQNMRGIFEFTLPDNTAAPTDLPGLEWDDTLVAGVSIRLCIRRGDRSAVVRLYGAVDPSVPEFVLSSTQAATTTGPGVNITGAAAAGVVKLQFTTTATGTDAEMSAVIEEVWAR